MRGLESIATAGRWGVFLAYLGLTVFLSQQSQIPGVEQIPDYCLHAPEFALLAVLLLTALSGTIRGPHTRGALWTALLFGVVYGVIDELHQWFVPGRQSSLKDAAVDAGATAATVLLAAVLARRSPASLLEHGDAGAARSPLPRDPSTSLRKDTHARGTARRTRAGQPAKAADPLPGGEATRQRGDLETDPGHGAAEAEAAQGARARGHFADERGHGAARAGSTGPLGSRPSGGARESTAGERAPDRSERGARDPDGAIPWAARVELLTRQGCHLCEQARAVLAGVLGPAGSGWTEVDIDEDPQLVSLYGREIPVVLINGIKRFKGRVERERLARLLADPGRMRHGRLSHADGHHDGGRRG